MTIYAIIDQFDQSSKPIMSTGNCKSCNSHRILIDGECTSCMEKRFPLLKEIAREVSCHHLQP